MIEARPSAADLVQRLCAMPIGELTAAVPTPLEIFAAGRLCLFGEHSDWAGSYFRC